MSQLIAVFCILFICFLGLGVGVLFFNRTASRVACGSAPREKTEPCPSQKAGICPVEDLSGEVRMARRGQISYPKH